MLQVFATLYVQLLKEANRKKRAYVFIRNIENGRKFLLFLAKISEHET